MTSYHVFFSFSSGLRSDMKVPNGTLDRILGRIDFTEKVLGLGRTPTYTSEGEDQKPGWSWRNTEKEMLEKAGSKPDSSLPQWWLAYRDRETLIEGMANAVQRHNDEIRWLYDEMDKWSEKTDWKDGEWEVITQEQAVEFWGGLQILELPKELWTRDHFTDHMQHVYELLSTGESRGVSLNCEPLKSDQVSSLINYIESELDQWGFDCRFAVPLDEDLQPYDHIASSYDGGYDWCSHCGPIHPNAFHARCRVCPRAATGECELRNEHPAEFEDEEDEGE
jgi:hypothetical protein